MIGAVASNLEALKPEQYLLAYLFMCSYALAIGQLFERPGRAFCAGLSVFSAAGFVACCAAWEPGVVVVAFALVGMGAFSASAWLFWTLVTWRGSRQARVALAMAEADLPAAPASPRPLRRLGTAARPG